MIADFPASFLPTRQVFSGDSYWSRVDYVPENSDVEFLESQGSLPFSPRGLAFKELVTDDQRVEEMLIDRDHRLYNQQGDPWVVGTKGIDCRKPIWCAVEVSEEPEEVHALIQIQSMKCLLQFQRSFYCRHCDIRAYLLGHFQRNLARTGQEGCYLAAITTLRGFFCIP